MSKNQSSGQRRSRGKHVLFLLVIAIGVYLFAELAAVFVRSLSGAYRFDSQVGNIAMSAHLDGSSEAIHPYLGWVHNPQVSQPEEIFGKAIPVNQLGFRDDNASVRRRSEDRFLVGVLGGSVAWHTSVAGADIIKDRLEAHPALKGRSIELVRLAAPGYKQPQQVMALNFIQVLGGEFDAVINIDGYNEAALALVENGYGGTSIAYPRAWSARTISALDPGSYAAAARLLQLRGSRQQAARDLLQSNFRWSPLRKLIWYATDQSRRNGMIELGLEVSRNRRGSFANHGPVDVDVERDELKSAVIDLWKRSSVQLQHLCEASGSVYLHVLQPNQYMAGTKVLSAHEVEFAFFAEQELGTAIREMYPRLVAEAEWLQNAGVKFSDQTMLFAGEADTIYCDPFCHYNQRGNEMLAAAVADELAQLISLRADSLSAVLSP